MAARVVRAARAGRRRRARARQRRAQARIRSRTRRPRSAGIRTPSSAAGRRRADQAHGGRGAGGVAGARGNLPPVSPDAPATPATPQARRRRRPPVGTQPAETTNYEVEPDDAPHASSRRGDIARLSVAVILDDDQSGEHRPGRRDERRARSRARPSELQKIQGLVAAAVGLETERGDQLTVENVAVRRAGRRARRAAQPAASAYGAGRSGTAARLGAASACSAWSRFLFVLRPMRPRRARRRCRRRADGRGPAHAARCRGSCPRPSRSSRARSKRSSTRQGAERRSPTGCRC